MVMIQDRMTLAPASCMVCNAGHGPAYDVSRAGMPDGPFLDMQQEDDDVPQRIRHLYICASCLRDLARHMSETRPEVGWKLVFLDDLDVMAKLYVDAQSEAMSLADRLADAEKLTANLIALLAGRDTRIGELDTQVAELKASAGKKSK